MKKLIIAFALMVMIAGATVSVLKWLEVGPFVKTETETAEEQQPEQEPPRFIEMEPLSIPVFQGDHVAATVQIQVKLEAVGEANADAIKRQKARLRDALLQEMHGFIPRMLRKTERLDVGILKTRMQMVADRTLGQGTVNRVLVQSVVNMPGQ